MCLSHCGKRMEGSGTDLCDQKGMPCGGSKDHWQCESTLPSHSQWGMPHVAKNESLLANENAKWDLSSKSAAREGDKRFQELVDEDLFDMRDKWQTNEEGILHQSDDSMINETSDTSIESFGSILCGLLSPLKVLKDCHVSFDTSFIENNKSRKAKDGPSAAIKQQMKCHLRKTEMWQLKLGLHCTDLACEV